MRKILSYIKHYTGFVLLSLIFAVITVSLTLYAPILIGDGLDVIISKGQVDFISLRSISLKLIVVILGVCIFQWLMSLCNNYITYKITDELRCKVFKQIERLPLSYIDSHSSGDILSRMVTDIDQFSDGLLMGFTQLFTGVITILGTLVFMFSINIWIALIVVIVTPLSLFVSRFIANKTYNMFKLQSQTRGEITQLTDEMIGNQKVVQAFNYAKKAESRFNTINQKLSEYSLKATFFSSLTNPCTRFVNSIVYALVGTFGAFAALHGLLSIGQLSAFLSYANQYTKPFNEISGVITEFQNALASASRVFEFLEEEPEIPDAIDAKVLEQPRGEISISHVDFSYNPKVSLIKDLNLEVQSGKRIAIVGPTGCGKSTLINLLMRFYDVNSGSIKVDGYDIRNITRESLRTNYGMVLQETWLKSGTIKENIAYGKKDVPLEDIIAAAKASHAHSFIKRLPNGYDTFIGENGGSLSEGQKQLLCITRVMLELPPMLILDEATSSIDTLTEIRIGQAFNKMMKGRTSFIVAHRLSTIKEADCILVMNDGNIIEQGTHEELLKLDGFYAKLYKSQFSLA
ncbi:ABC transporter, ATP-binding/permease protein [Lachnospiraceae bacterium TWA4]|nr:ABC transporter, ATP-binding/permease protein [Lachnospiraceae bacterium TWA4]